MQPGDDGFDWKSDEAKEAKVRFDGLLNAMDSGAPEGAVRTTVPLGTGDNGEALSMIVWRKP